MEKLMKKIAVFSGFLGSGKTTMMIALTRYYTAHYGNAAMISNDLGEGVTLADDRLARLSGVNASQITDECICFCHDVLSARLNTYYDEGCELVVSEIPGFGVGALEHVYHGLNNAYPGQFELAPFTVLIEPCNAALLQRERNEDMAVILHAQLMEADLIVLNKRDLMESGELATTLSWLGRSFPQARILAVSALTGEGLEELCQALRQGSASLRHPEIDYEGEALQNAMDHLSEFYIEYAAQVCCNHFDGTAYLSDIAHAVQDVLRASNYEVPHMKLLAWGPEGDFGKVDLLGIDRPIETPRSFSQPCTNLAVILNATAACPAAALDETIQNAMETVSRLYQLEIIIHKKECFSMSE